MKASERELLAAYQHVRRRGSVVKAGEGLEFTGYGARALIKVAPVIGSRLNSCQAIYHEPGETFAIHAHPVSETVYVVYQGKGQVFLDDAWHDIEAGDVVYVPEGYKHGTRNLQTNPEVLVVYDWGVPPPLEQYELGGWWNQVYAEIESGADRVKKSYKGQMPPRQSGQKPQILNVDEGAEFYNYGCLMKFIVWPNMGSRMISCHCAYQSKGDTFNIHRHPQSEDTVVVLAGRGQVFLDDRWYDLEPGDVFYAPEDVKHGTRNLEYDGVFQCAGCAAPPQMELYELAGYMPYAYVEIPGAEAVKVYSPHDRLEDLLRSEGKNQGGKD